MGLAGLCDFPSASTCLSAKAIHLRGTAKTPRSLHPDGSMDKNVTEIALHNLKFLEVSASKNEASFTIASRWVNQYDKGVHGGQWLQFADALWEQVLELFVVICGFNRDYIYPSRWDWSSAEYQIVRRFNSPAWAERPYESFNAFIHLRDSFATDRSIDNGFIDLFLDFSSDPYALEHAPIDNDDEILTCLNDWKSPLTDILTAVARIILRDSGLQVKTLYPVWEEECEIETGGDAYWLKGILT